MLCDVSTSVTSATTFFLSVLHALHDSFASCVRSCSSSGSGKIIKVFERERDFPRAASTAIFDEERGMQDISGYTDYGRVLTEFLALIEDKLRPRRTVIVLGDARTNGPPRGMMCSRRSLPARAARTGSTPEPPSSTGTMAIP